MLSMLLLAALPAHATTAISIDNATIDGLEIHRLDCLVDSGGLGASAAILAQLASQKDALDGCAPQGAAFTIQWRWEPGQLASAKVLASTAMPAAACVEDALLAAQGAQLGSCSATVLVGEPNQAARAWRALSDGSQLSLDELPLRGAIVHTDAAEVPPSSSQSEEAP